jgi:arylsulfatase A-like enzyme
MDFLDRRDPTKPFFLKLSYHRPHPPLDPPLHYLERYIRRSLPDIPVGDWAESWQLPMNRGFDSPVPKNKEQIDLARRAYYAQITHIDCQINRIIHALREHNVIHNTLIMFISDHGEMLYDHNSVAKTLPYPASAQVPFLVKLPPAWQQNVKQEVNAVVDLQDVMPTLLDAAGVDIPDSVDGKSVLPLMQGETDSIREYLHGEHSAGAFSNHWIRADKYLYAWYSQTGEEQLFDIESDPNTMHSIAADNQEKVSELRSYLISELKDREEGYVKNGQLVTGCEAKSVLNKVFDGWI